MLPLTRTHSRLIRHTPIFISYGVELVVVIMSLWQNNNRVYLFSQGMIQLEIKIIAGQSHGKRLVSFLDLCRWRILLQIHTHQYLPCIHMLDRVSALVLIAIQAWNLANVFARFAEFHLRDLLIWRTMCQNIWNLIKKRGLSVIKVLVQIRVWSMNVIYVYTFLFFM